MPLMKEHHDVVRARAMNEIIDDLAALWQAQGWPHVDTAMSLVDGGAGGVLLRITLAVDRWPANLYPLLHDFCHQRLGDDGNGCVLRNRPRNYTVDLTFLVSPSPLDAWRQQQAAVI